MFIIICFLISILILVIYLNSTIKPIDYFEEYNAHHMLPIKYPTSKRKSTIEKYLMEVECFSTLSHEEETKLANDIQNGDQNSLEILVKPHLKNVIQIVQEINSHLHQELINEGNLGLIEGGRAYDGKSTFRKFARPYIVKNIKQSLADNPSYKQPYVELPRGVCMTCLMNRKQKV